MSFLADQEFFHVFFTFFPLQKKGKKKNLGHSLDRKHIFFRVALGYLMLPSDLTRATNLTLRQLMTLPSSMWSASPCSTSAVQNLGMSNLQADASPGFKR